MQLVVHLAATFPRAPPSRFVSRKNNRFQTDSAAGRRNSGERMHFKTDDELSCSDFCEPHCTKYDVSCAFVAEISFAFQMVTSARA